MFFKVCVTVLELLSFVFLEGKVILNKEDPGKCDLSATGKNSIVNDRDGNERVLICVKIDGKYSWREIDIFPELSTLGEFFNPAEDCSDIVRKKRDSKSGLYWIKGFGLKKVTKERMNNCLGKPLFIGCGHGKCCACFGPKGASGDFCTPACQSVNGGTVTTTSHTWFWVRSSVPTKPVWNKCTKFQVQTQNVKTETHFIHEITGVSKKGSCSKKEIPNLVSGVVKVGNNKTLNSLPLVKGLLSYREDNTKLYLSNGQSWEALGKEKQDIDLAHDISELKKKVQVLEQELNYTIDGLKVKSGKSCQDIYLSSKKTAASGVYWIQLLEGSSKKLRKAFPVYCDMETHGGGWTLVYSYTFTDYNNFRSGSNAVTPRPNWPASRANVPISTTPPLDESSRGAIDFNLWKEIGKEILIKSNINDWIVCQPNGGSMVTEKNGPLICQNIKNVATKCQGIAPNRINWYTEGPYLSASSLFYFFDGYSASYWPVHDPCGKYSSNEKRGVTNPGGAIYIR